MTKFEQLLAEGHIAASRQLKSGRNGISWLSRKRQKLLKYRCVELSCLDPATLRF